MNSFWLVAGLGIGLSALTILINKLMINEKLVDETREKIKKLQKELKDLDPKSKEFQEKQEKILDLNTVIMKQQFKPMFITFLPYIIVFYLVGNIFAFSPIDVGSNILLEVKGNNATIVSDCLGINETISGNHVFHSTVGSANCTIFINGEKIDNIIGKKDVFDMNIGNTYVKITPPKKVFINLPFKLPFFGDKIGWLGTFILFSFATSMVLNRALKGVYLRKW